MSRKILEGKYQRRFRVARLVVCLILVSILAAAVVQPVKAAGTYTHSWFIDYAIQILVDKGGYSELVDILNRNKSSAYYGSVFPDITYGSIDAEWGEEMHDTGDVKDKNYTRYLQFLFDKGYDPSKAELQFGYYKEFLNDPDSTAVLPKFRSSLMNQILPRFKNNPRSSEDEMMIAFLFGLIAHQEADHSWHWDQPDWVGLEAYAFDNGYNTCGFGWPLGQFNQP